MGGLIPLSDASRRPVRVPLVTPLLILVNVVVFLLELTRGDSCHGVVSGSSADVSGHHRITILIAMFMHGNWSHIIGKLVFLWAFGREIEGAMGGALSDFLSAWRFDSDACPGGCQPAFNRPQSGCQWSDRRSHGRVHRDLPSGSH